MTTTPIPLPHGGRVDVEEHGTVDEPVQPQLEVTGVTQRFDEQVVVDDLSFKVFPGELVSLLGPSGCGKSTTLRVIAGLQVPNEGRVAIGGVPVVDTAAGKNMPPEKRDIGMVFQSYAIWPHMTVFNNVAFPLRMRRVTTAEKERQVMDVLRATGMEEFAHKPATRLSGGQQQRVALARALVFRPSLMLLDEPLSNLDAQLRERMRSEIRRLQREFNATAVFVTHDQEEAMSLSDRIGIMKDGRLEQMGTPHELYSTPRTPFVRDFLGHVFALKGEVRSGGSPRVEVKGANGSTEVAIPTASAQLRDGQSVLATWRPEDVTIRPDEGGCGPNQVSGYVLGATYLGPQIQYRMSVGSTEATVWGPVSQPWEVGSRVIVDLDPDKMTVWDD